MKTSVKIKTETEVIDSAIPSSLSATTTEKAEERFRSLILADIKQSEAEIEREEGVEFSNAFNMLGKKYGVRS